MVQIILVRKTKYSTDEFSKQKIVIRKTGLGQGWKKPYGSYVLGLQSGIQPQHCEKAVFSIKVCVTILITCIICSSRFFFWILAKSICPWKLPSKLCILTTPQVSLEFQPIEKIWTFDLAQSRSRGWVSRIRNIRRDRLPCFFVHAVPMCTSNLLQE
jgi:hypothetical protein